MAQPVGPGAGQPLDADPEPLFEDEKFHDHCGVVGIASDRSVASYLYYAMQALQHRGQESAGIVTLDGKFEYRIHKGMGLVDSVFDAPTIEKLRGNIGIGHVRYSTSAGSTEENAQPQMVMGGMGGIALAHNGNIPTVSHLMDELKAKGWAFYTGNDTEVAVRMLANLLAKHDGNAKVAIDELMDHLEGAYSMCILIGDQLYALRDPWGIKPLCIGSLPGGGYVVTSESVALDVIGATFLRDVEPGEVLRVTKDAVETLIHRPAEKAARCFFEYVYFARSDAFMDGRLNAEVRERIGARLWKEHPIEADLVVPVPDSGRSHAQGLSDASGIRYSEALMKNRYVHRTFIMPTQESRELNVRLKVNPIRQVLDGKRVILVDDSIVRGTTMRRIVRMLRDAGAKEVHLRIGAPPILAPCYLGIDMSTRDQLIAARLSIEEICKEVGADSLGYISIDGIVDAIGFPADEMCLGCVTGTYPVHVDGEAHRFDKRKPALTPPST